MSFRGHMRNQDMHGSGDGHPSFPGGIDLYLYIYISFSPFHSTPQKSTSDFQNHEQWKVLSPKATGFYHPYKWRFWASHGVVEPLLPGLGLHFGLLHDATEKFQRDDLQAEDGGKRLGA